MDDSVFRGLARWPNVPKAYGCLALDRRGLWFPREERVTRPQSISFFNRNNGSERSGTWFVQNGPQRVYVGLEDTPWVYRLEGGNTLFTHTGPPVKQPKQVCLDDRGNLLPVTEHGLGLAD